MNILIHPQITSLDEDPEILNNINIFYTDKLIFIRLSVKKIYILVHV